MKSRIDRVIQYAGEEYRLRAGQEAPNMPEALREILIDNGYLADATPPLKPAKGQASRKPKEG